MKAIITGGAGFIGSHLVDALIRQGVSCHVIDDFTTGKVAYKNKNATYSHLSICDHEIVDVFKDVKADVLFHLAAQADVANAIKSPQVDAEVNIKGTIQVLEAAVQSSIKKIVFSSTSAVYGAQTRLPISVDTPPTPLSFYGASKLAAEQYIKVYRQLYGLDYTILRYGNVYGPRQTPKGEGGVISIFLNRLNHNEDIHIFGDGQQSRDFIYVDDVVNANIKSLSLGRNETLNVATQSETNLNEIIHHLQALHQKPINLHYNQARVGDIRNSCLAIEETKTSLQWQPMYSLFEGLKKTNEYTKAI